MDGMDWRKGANRALVEALLAVKNEDEAERFLRDLLTEEEITEFAKRFAAARLLHAKVPYSEIQIVTGLSATTVARVSKWVQGDIGGYRLVIDRLNRHTHSSGSRKVH